jgi:hypothetical protein
MTQPNKQIAIATTALLKKAMSEHAGGLIAVVSFTVGGGANGSGGLRVTAELSLNSESIGTGRNEPMTLYMSGEQAKELGRQLLIYATDERPEGGKYLSGGSAEI